MTGAEKLLWSKLRGKQIFGIQFYRQRPLGNYIVDFYAPTAKLIVEVDGAQHLSKTNAKRDVERDGYLNKKGLKVLRFDNLQVLKDTEAVMEVILSAVRKT